jgi:hypothetical protein
LSLSSSCFSAGFWNVPDFFAACLLKAYYPPGFDTPPQISPLVRNILVVKTSHPSPLQQAVARTPRLWLSERFCERAPLGKGPRKTTSEDSAGAGGRARWRCEGNHLQLTIRVTSAKIHAWRKR